MFTGDDYRVFSLKFSNNTSTGKAEFSHSLSGHFVAREYHLVHTELFRSQQQTNITINSEFENTYFYVFFRLKNMTFYVFFEMTYQKVVKIFSKSLVLSPSK